MCLVTGEEAEKELSRDEESAITTAGSDTCQSSKHSLTTYLSYSLEAAVIFLVSWKYYIRNIFLYVTWAATLKKLISSKSNVIFVKKI